MEVTENDDVLRCLEKHNLASQYKKAKRRLEVGDTVSVDLKKRKPKAKGMYQFKINRKYRAFCYFDDGILRVFEIDNHQ